MKVKYGIVGYHKDYPEKMIHLCLYEGPPGMNDVKSLTLELEHDDEFGIGDNIVDIVFRKATKMELSNLDSLEIWRIEDL
jgi:hypothetical protein